MERAIVCTMALACGALLRATDAGWPAYGGDAGGTRYSAAAQVNRINVAKLHVAWTYHTGALSPKTDLNEKAAFEATPILIDGTLYVSTPFDQVIALDPATGAARWKYDPDVDRAHDYSEVTSRGVAAWRGPQGWRIILGTIDARLLALDAKTGKLAAGFGDGGKVDLSRGVDVDERGEYEMTSPPAVVGNVIVVGSSIADNRAAKMERGLVRGFDARTGKLLWSWDPIPWAGTGVQRKAGAANAWAPLAADPARDLVFVPTGSASPDYYGGLRQGAGKWANSVVAIKASTGRFVWGFQVVHHDLWDYDVPAQPSLITYKGRPAIAITTKMGNVFVLDRLTGKPLIDVQEKPVPQSDVAGEHTWPTQPFSALPPLVPHSLKREDAWGATEQDRKWCHDKIASLRNEGIFTPPSLKGTLVVPGNVGGVNWGSAAYDASRGLLIANTNRVPFAVRLFPSDRWHEEVMAGRNNRMKGEFAPQHGTPYGMYREPLFAPSGGFCNAPPWGATVALDLNTNRIAWSVPLGHVDRFGPRAPAGSPNLGGPMVTAGGLVFTAAAMDTYFRAFDIETGKELWKSELPASAQATPMTYTLGGKQFVVICAGGHGKLATKQGDAVVAFTL